MPNILLGVCGGISAYKSCELVRELQRHGCAVRAILTRAARKFVAPLTFEALTRSAAYTDLFADGAHGAAHIELARWADALLVAPATANTISRFANGQAADFLAAVYLGFRGPVILAPAMNTAMWEHAAVRANLELLRRRGARIVDPVEGELACGETGVGRMAEPAEICAFVLRQLGGESPLRGARVLVTAGPTREHLDPVRFLSSPSSGKMGLAVAREAVRRGARVTVVHGPLSVAPDFEAEWVRVTSAQEMAREVERKLPADIAVAAAAVADQMPARRSEKKLRRNDGPTALELAPTPDVLAAMVRARRAGDLVVGFAAETENVVPNARRKLEEKGADLIVANEVHTDRRGFSTDRTAAAILGRRGELRPLRDLSKAEVAFALWDEIERLWAEKRADR